MTNLEWIVSVFVLLGALVSCISAIGILRFPDLLSRMHATGKMAALGISLILVGVSVYAYFHLNDGMMALKALFIVMLLFVLAPVSSHLFGRSVYYSVENDAKK